ncbi:MAG: CHAP domain-containing protein [Methylacidiphilales bacterium]|nr:CHAP domain-containing protein [Candidatus Methylacidiphilales bacterium]
MGRKDDPKCNIFVHDVIVEAGYPAPIVEGRPARAGEWYQGKVKGWRILASTETPKPGDIAASWNSWGFLPFIPSGHVGIVVAGISNGVLSPGINVFQVNLETVSSSSRVNPSGIIVQNDWAFRPNQNDIRFLRYVGK